MLIELYIVFQVILIGLFFTSFFTKNPLIWTITLVIAGVLMYTSYNVEYYVYEYNATILAYQPIITTHSMPYMMGVDLIFASLSLILGLFDMFDRFGWSKKESKE